MQLVSVCVNTNGCNNVNKIGTQMSSDPESHPKVGFESVSGFGFVFCRLKPTFAVGFRVSVSGFVDWNPLSLSVSGFGFCSSKPTLTVGFGFRVSVSGFVAWNQLSLSVSGFGFRRLKPTFAVGFGFRVLQFETNFNSRFRVSGFGFRSVLGKVSLQSRFRVSGFAGRSQLCRPLSGSRLTQMNAFLPTQLVESLSPLEESQLQRIKHRSKTVYIYPCGVAMGGVYDLPLRTKSIVICNRATSVSTKPYQKHVLHVLHVRPLGLSRNTSHLLLRQVFVSQTHLAFCNGQHTSVRCYSYKMKASQTISQNHWESVKRNSTFWRKFGCSS